MPGKNNGHDPDFDNFDDDTPTGAAGLDIDLPGPKEDDIEITVVDDTPAQDRAARPLKENVEEPTAEELASYSDKVQARIKNLTHARHDERRKREAIEREQQELIGTAQRLLDENKRLRTFAVEGTAEYSKVAVAAAEAKVVEARRKVKEAKEAYDTDAEIAALEEFSDAKAEVLVAKNVRPPALQDPVDDVKIKAPADSPALEPETKAWMARNPWFNAPGKEDVTSFALGLHKQLVDSGVKPATDVYFERIDARMKAKFPELYPSPTERDDPGRDDPPSRTTSVVAPAARSAAKRRITLTASQVALCKKLNLSPQQYAAQLMQEGA